VLRRMSLSVLAATAIALPGAATAQPATQPSQPPATVTPAVTPPTVAPAVTPTVTTVLPGATAAVVMINTDPAAWGELNRFNPYINQSGELPFGIPFSLTMLLRDFDYARDIKSWLGDHVGVALLPLTSPQDTLLSNLVLLIPTTNAEKSNALLEKAKEFAKPTAERDYKGITILEWTAPTPDGETLEQSVPTPQPIPPAKTTPHKSGHEAALPSAKGMAPLTPTTSQPRAIAAEPMPTPSPADVSPPTADPPLPDDNGPVDNGPVPPFPGLGNKFAIALLPNQIVIAAETVALEKLIDAQETNAGAALAQAPAFQRTFNHPQFQKSLMVGYGDYGNILKLINQTLPIPPNPSNPDAPQQSIFTARQIEFITQRYSTFDVLTWVRPNGILSESNVYFTTPQPQRATADHPDANQILTRLPAATYAAGNSRNFKQQWQEILEFYEGDPQSQELLKRAKLELTKATGLDLDKDLIDWMDGEYALFFYPTQEGFFNYIDPRFNLGVGLMVQTSDRPRAEATLRKIDQFLKTSTAKTYSPAMVASRTVKGQPITSWEVKDGKRLLSVLSHSWIAPDTLMITTGIGPAQELTPKPYLPLNLNPTFTEATGGLIKPNDGFTYVNMGSTLSFVYSLMRSWVPMDSLYAQEAQQLLGTIRSMSSTQTTTPEKIQAESFWVLGTYTPKPQEQQP
jgi:hypothetical protein